MINLRLVCVYACVLLLKNTGKIILMGIGDFTSIFFPIFSFIMNYVEITNFGGKTLEAIALDCKNNANTQTIGKQYEECQQNYADSIYFAYFEKYLQGAV